MASRIELEMVALPRIAQEDRHPVRTVEDDAPPSRLVGEDWRTRLSVEDELFDVPEAVQLRLRRAASEPLMDLIRLGQQKGGKSEEENRAQDQRSAVEPLPREERADLGGLHLAVEDQDVRQSPQIGQDQEDGQAEKVGRKQFYRHVVAKVQQDDVG